MTKAFVFPGQGSQAVGMGKQLADAFPQAKAVFDEVDEALGEKLSQIIFEGPEDKLTLTENAQPALMAVSLAALRALEAEGGFKLADAAQFVAGHSLGEYSALAAAGTFTLADTARLLRARGRAMQAAVPVGEGAMAALIGLDFADIEVIAKEAAAGETCDIANDNGGGQLVVSGARGAVERACALAKEWGAKRALLLPVSAPFHCAMMAPAADAMADALAEVEMREPVVPVVANVTARAVSSVAEVRSLLVQQVTGMVRWRESVLYMSGQGVDTLVELGAGKVLSGLARRIDGALSGTALGTPEAIGAYLQAP